MPASVEIKARCAHPERVRRACVGIGTPEREGRQVDAYFVAARGRFKLREDEGGARLIFYRRLSSPLPKESAAEILPVGPAERKVVGLLERATGVRVRIEKHRAVWRVGEARVNLDRVDGLGSFVEIEVGVEAAGGGDRAREIAADLMARLGVADADLVPYSYAELATIRAAAERWRETLRAATSPGTLFLLDGASCSGKTTLVERLRDEGGPVYVPRYCTRDKRPGEVDGREYRFVGHERFFGMAAAGAFLEFRDFEFGMSYGLAWEDCLAPLLAGKCALAVMNLGSVRHVKEVFPEAVTVLIDAPEETIRARLVSRGSNKPHEIEERLANARRVNGYRPCYDRVIANDEGRLEDALADLRAILGGTA
jgi:guanylate kinase